MKQIVGHRKIGPVRGILLILGLIVALMAVNYVCLYYLSPWIGYQPASLVFWIVGALMAMQMLRIFVMKFEYELNADLLRLNRKYGKRPRHIEDIYLNRLLFVGEADEAKKRYPKAKKVTAMHASAGLPVTAVVYRTADDIHVAHIQANEELKRRLMDRAKGK